MSQFHAWVGAFGFQQFIVKMTHVDVKIAKVEH